MTVVNLTADQAAAFERGESITLTPPPKTKQEKRYDLIATENYGGDRLSDKPVYKVKGATLRPDGRYVGGMYTCIDKGSGTIRVGATGIAGFNPGQSFVVREYTVEVPV